LTRKKPARITKKKTRLLTWEDRNREAATATVDILYPAGHVLDKSTVVVYKDNPILHTKADSTHLEPIFR
jgi:hypothetical protein